MVQAFQRMKVKDRIVCDVLRIKVDLHTVTEVQKMIAYVLLDNIRESCQLSSM